MLQHSRASLWDLVAGASDPSERFVSDDSARVTLGALADGTSLDRPPAALLGQSVLIAADQQISAALALVELDGVARRIVVCPPDLGAVHVPSVIATAGVEAVISEYPSASYGETVCRVTCSPGSFTATPRLEGRFPTQWILFTSGTTGAPKLVVHNLETLVGSVARMRALGDGAVWSTFYDIRRYGGLQMLLRALVGGGSMVLSSAREAPADFLARVAANRVTHISGTPSHWRRALMSPACRAITPNYVRLSGEVADQDILGRLQACYPHATVAHAFATTEAGVAFDVSDGHAGFPARLIGIADGPVEMRVAEGTLRIRSNRTALGYLGDRAGPLADDEGFVDTGDVVELRGDRYYFSGRREGVINVGGLKVHPEEVEAIINQHPDVAMSFVKARRSPITGAIVAAEVVAKSSVDGGTEAFKAEIIELCRRALAAYKVPATVRVVPALEIGASGKLIRVSG